jgi:hypothetical protein
MLTPEQITQLAPDPASLKAGREQARPAKWQDAGIREPGVKETARTKQNLIACATRGFT